MKSKSYFVDRIIKLRGGEGDRDELMKLQMVDILKLLNDERTKHAKPAEPDDIVDMIPAEKEDSDDQEEAPTIIKEEPAPAPKKEGEKQASPPQSDSDDEGIVSIVKRFLFTPAHKE
jgi:hypothetical protein